MTTLVVFLVLRILAGWQGLFTWLGLDGLGDPASLPLLLLGAQIGAVVTGLVTAWMSRAHEREADLDAFDVLARPDDMVEMLRRLHVKNLSDLGPGSTPAGAGEPSRLRPSGWPSCGPGSSRDLVHLDVTQASLSCRSAHDGSQP